MHTACLIYNDVKNFRHSITNRNCQCKGVEGVHCACLIYNDVKNFNHSIIPTEIVSVREWRVCTVPA